MPESSNNVYSKTEIFSILMFDIIIPIRLLFKVMLFPTLPAYKSLKQTFVYNSSSYLFKKTYTGRPSERLTSIKYFTDNFRLILY